ncbi:hypothetical protein CGRA01v4_10955 [Colletotrichum graminicola]|nr:hypothetical protein CGRA01v4_10955 [Colletotrichum graminicola]
MRPSTPRSCSCVKDRLKIGRPSIGSSATSEASVLGR